MSHYTGHIQTSLNGRAPRSIVGFIGGAFVATGFIGFYAYLNGRHERKHLLDRSNSTGKIATWESRMIQRNFPSIDPSNPATLRAARIEARATPLPQVRTEHDAHHRTISQERELLAANAGTKSESAVRVFEVPTAQRGRDGLVYTKSPAWRDRGRTGSMSKDPKEAGETQGAIRQKMDDMERGVDKIVDEVKEDVQGWFKK